MTHYVEVTTSTGTVMFETTNNTSSAGPERVSRRGDNVIATLDERLDTTLSSVRPAAENVLHTFAGLGLDNVEVEFGLNIDAEAGAVIAKTGVSAHFTIKLTGKPQLTTTDM